jgi:hypothetical protein
MEAQFSVATWLHRRLSAETCLCDVIIASGTYDLGQRSRFRFDSAIGRTVGELGCLLLPVDGCEW